MGGAEACERGKEGAQGPGGVRQIWAAISALPLFTSLPAA